MKRLWFFVLVLAGITSILHAGNTDVLSLLEQDTGYNLEVSTSLIRVDARVRNKEGNPVRGLKVEDFEIYQDGRLQTITEFHEIGRKTGSSDPRIIVFIIDDLGLEQKKYDQFRTAVRHFADNVMQPSDIVGLARTAGGGMVFQPLTKDAAELTAAVDLLQWSGEPAGPEVNLQILTPTPWTIFVRPCLGPGCVPMSQTLPLFSVSPIPLISTTRDMSYQDAIVNIVGELAEIPHRKAVILFSNNDPDMKQMGLALTDQMIRASVSLYQCGLPGWRRKWSKIAENTGGYAVKAKEDSFREVGQVLDDYGHGYLLGYEPDAETLEMDRNNLNTTGGTTTITVRSSDKPKTHSLKIKTDIRGVKVHTRSAFGDNLLVPRTDPMPSRTSNKLYRNMIGSSPFISGNLKVTAEALPFFSASQGNTVHVTLHVDGKDLVFGSVSEDGMRNAQVEVACKLTRDRIISRHTGQAGFVAPIREFDEYRKRGFSTSFEMQTPVPGLYSLRIGVRQRNEGKVGNVSILVEVPDFRRSGLATSGIVTYSRLDRPDSAGSVYTTTRKIHKSDPFGCYLQVYNARRDKSSSTTRLESQFRLYRDNTLVQASEMSQVQYGGEGTAFPIIVIDFDSHFIEELPSGNYLLEILVVDRLAEKKKNAVIRSVSIELVE